MTEDLLERTEGRVAILTMNRPDRLNAMSGPMLDAMKGVGAILDPKRPACSICAR